MRTEETEEGMEGICLVIGSEPLDSELTDVFLVSKTHRLRLTQREETEEREQWIYILHRMPNNIGVKEAGEKCP